MKIYLMLVTCGPAMLVPQARETARLVVQKYVHISFYCIRLLISMKI
jgi:hypothetical protein